MTAAPPRAGVGLRRPHHAALLAGAPRPAWVEVHPENLMRDGTGLAELEAIGRHTPVSLHGVGLSLGSPGGLDTAHLDRLADLASRLEPCLVSEHLAWCRAGNVYHAELLPLPLTPEALEVVRANVDRTQDRLRRRILVENASAMFRFEGETMSEAAFLAELVRRTGCGLLVDVNNLAVNARNLGLDPADFLDAVPPDAVGEIHLAGHSVRALESGVVVAIDDHAGPPSPLVWDVYRRALSRFGAVPTLIEWDHDIPPWRTLVDLAASADRCLEGPDARAA